jgi:hypothetical protein
VLVRPLIAAASLALVLPLCLARGAAAQDQPTEVRARRAPVAPVLDGVLDDEVWSGEPVPAGTWVSYNPLRGEPAQQQTDVWIGYDEAAVYFAFRCRDTGADGIRTTVSRRDSIFSDDWIALSLDSSRAGQMAYHMFVNPSGVQMDAINAASGGEDFAADWLWESAGRVTEEGYVVEIRLPLESIRFRGGSDVRMGILFFRRISRLGVSWSWPEMPPGTWVFEAHVPVVFDELRQPLLLEVIPNLTVSRTQSRGDDRAWRAPDGTGDVGASVKYGVTSTITLDATVNPDFSQVESDAFQVEINERFPVFFSEKRPFFMEGLGLFNLAGTGEPSTMRTAVHTRRIVDPSAGVKLTGTAGRQTFGLLSAADASTPESSTRYTVVRAARNLRPAQHVGVLVADSEYGPAYNRVIGGDISLRHGERWRWNASALSAHSRSGGRDATHGGMAQASYAYQTRRVLVAGQVEHLGDDFRMDTAFFNQAGLTRVWQYVEPMFYPDATGTGWLKRVAPFVYATRADNRLQGGTEQIADAGVRFNFTRQGFLRVNTVRGHETFAARRFPLWRASTDGSAQVLRWLRLGGAFDRGTAIFYDDADPFLGTRTHVRVNVGFQPNANLNQDLSYAFVDFDRRATGEPVFDVHVVNLRNTYQFNRQFFLRLIAQLDSSRRRVLGDALASYELVPGTVVHAGYGSILEALPGERYVPSARAFFFKASYLARF